jgi:chromosome segregation ATPase
MANAKKKEVAQGECATRKALDYALNMTHLDRDQLENELAIVEHEIAGLEARARTISLRIKTQTVRIERMREGVARTAPYYDCA